MVTKLKEVDAVIIGQGLTGVMMASNAVPTGVPKRKSFCRASATS